MKVISYPHPFRQEQQVIPAPIGSSIKELITLAVPNYPYKNLCNVWLNGEPVPCDSWGLVCPKVNDFIIIKTNPGGDVGRIILGIFVMIAAVVVSALTYGALAGPAGIGMASWAGGLIAGLAGVTVSFIGHMVINALIPPTTPSSAQQAQIEDTRFSITGSSNQVNPYGPIPLILGRNKMFPLHGAEAYTQINPTIESSPSHLGLMNQYAVGITERAGKDQWVRLLLVWGFGRIKLENLRIGEDSYANFEGLEMEHRNLDFVDKDGNLTHHYNEPLTLFSDDIHEEFIAVELACDEENIRTSQDFADELSIDISFLQGLGAFDDSGNRQSMYITFDLYYRKDGTEGWILVTPLTGTAATGSIVRIGHRWIVPESGKYNVKLIRRTANDSSRSISVSTWTALRTIRYTNPIDCPVPLAMSAFRIKASGELQGNINTINGIATSIAPNWKEELEEWVDEPVNNPSSLFRLVCQGIHTQQPYDDSDLNIPILEDWWQFCTDQGFEFNRVVDTKSEFWDILSEIASAGRAARNYTDSKVGVIIDREQEFEIGPVFTPRNTNGFSCQISYPVIPHGFLVNFKNEENDYKDDCRIVLNDGYQIDGRDAWGELAPDLPEATYFEEIKFPGLTKPELVFRFGRYHLAAAKLRRESYEFECSLEGAYCTRGSRIKFAEDVIAVSSSYGRVKELTYNEFGEIVGVVLDEFCTMDYGTNYSVRFSLFNGESLLKAVVNDAEPLEGGYFAPYFKPYFAPTDYIPYTTKTLVFVEPVDPEVYLIEIGNLFVFGESEKETIDLLVKSVRPRGNLNFIVEGIPYDENIYLADQGTIPPFDSKITAPREWTSPVVGNIRSGGDVLIRMEDGSWSSRILVSLSVPGALDINIVGVEAQFKENGSDETPLLVKADLVHWEVSLSPVGNGKNYEIRLRYFRQDGRVGPWSQTYYHTVEGKTAPPQNVTGFNVSQIKEFIYFTWNQVADLDLAGYELRFGPVNVDWLDAETITKVMKGTAFSTLTIVSGTYDFLIKAFDSSGNSSEVATRKTLKVLQFYQIMSRIENEPMWKGTLENCIRDSILGFLIPTDQDIPSGDNFDVFDNFVVNPYSSYNYIGEEIDLGSDMSCRAYAIVISGLGPGEAGDGEFKLYFRSKPDGGAWSSWEEWEIGLFTARYVQFKIEKVSSEGLAFVEKFETVVDRSY